jgi:hypothetical protein
MKKDISDGMLAIMIFAAIIMYFLDYIIIIIALIFCYYCFKWLLKDDGDTYEDELFDSYDETDYVTDRLDVIKDETNNLKETFVYLMYDSSTDYYKIGYSKDAIYREKTLQAEKPTIDLIVKKEYFSKDKAREVERLLHQKFYDKRGRGEWFKLDANDLDYIKGYLE